MWTTVIAVLGTLAGGALASLSQWTDRRAERQRAHRQLVADRVAELLDAVLVYRERHWLLIAALRDGQTETASDRAARYAARSEVTRARGRLILATQDPALRAAAEEAAWSAIELSGIETGPATERRFSEAAEAALAAGRERSRDAHTALLDLGAAYAHNAR
ncbi:hypothetical protein [Streptomyces sp. URMC 129]|uniref:hypothetical protein n=1 Tax=Streptomyces sp. URMC 129 TaxID=3423407 RepID=UPI003F1BF23D